MEIGEPISELKSAIETPEDSIEEKPVAPKKLAAAIITLKSEDETHVQQSFLLGYMAALQDPVFF